MHNDVGLISINHCRCWASDNNDATWTLIAPMIVINLVCTEYHLCLIIHVHTDYTDLLNLLSSESLSNKKITFCWYYQTTSRTVCLFAYMYMLLSYIITVRMCTNQMVFYVYM